MDEAIRAIEANETAIEASGGTDFFGEERSDTAEKLEGREVLEAGWPGVKWDVRCDLQSRVSLCFTGGIQEMN